MVKYIFVTGGVISGIGKGVATASIGKVLQERGFKVTAIKIDPYLNYDAGTLRPTEHGEVWVTEDGGEIDQDLGHYERFLDITLTKDNNITSGKIYYSVITKERRGEYLGQTVQPIPHVTDEIKNWIRNVAEKAGVDFCLVEIGGVVGDYENVLFLEAARQMKLEEPNNVLFVHVAYLPLPKFLGEMKTKPVQHSVKMLREIGIQPDFIIARSEYPLDDVRKKKLALFCNVSVNDIIMDPDLEIVYELPLIFEEEGLGDKILRKLNMESRAADFSAWREFVNSLKNPVGEVKIAIVGKYFATGRYMLPDVYISVIEAIKHACAYFRVKPILGYVSSEDLESYSEAAILKEYDGIVVPGGFGRVGVEGKINAIRYARENKIPFLGLCFGLQLAVVEFSRNVCGLRDANSTEIDENTPNPVIDLLPEQRILLKEGKIGASMRLGSQKVIIKEGTLAHRCYNSTEVFERFRHRYEINPKYVDILESHGFIFSGVSSNGIKQIGELRTDIHPFFIGSQFHPEFTSRPLKPNPLFKGFIEAALKYREERVA